METNIKKCKKILQEKEDSLQKLNAMLADEVDQQKKDCLQMEIKKMCDEITDFICNIYAKIVFEIYNPKKPRLVRRLTKEVFTWDKAFGDNFEAIPLSLRESLVGLIEGSGKYKFK